MSNNSTTPEFTYEVLTQEDPETGELVLPIPPELMKQMGWQEGDDLSFDLDNQGRWIISKK
jgi:bifunctional DNA-binding transcriptional regulator/antitoxin component of YhaV-PrlF toxin-antitoxin module